MDPRLKKLSDNDEAYERRRVSECQRLISEKGHPGKLIDAQPEVQPLLSACLKAAAKPKENFPSIMGEKLSRDLDGRKQLAGNLIRELWRDYINPLQTKSNLAGRMADRVERIRAMKPADVRIWTIDAVVGPEITRCESLLSELEWLREFPEKLSVQVRLINEQLDVCDGKVRPAEMFTPVSNPDEGKQFDVFDPRK